MSRLSDTWRGLADLPATRLADLPTPVERLDDVLPADARAELWVKRDDLTAPGYGGNKVRKLEWLLGEAEARGASAIVTAGAFGSHHVLATTLYGGRRGLDVYAVLIPQPWTDHVEENLRADLALGARLVPAGSYAEVAARMFGTAAALRAKGQRAQVVPPGGSSPTGAVGFVEAGLELAAQIEAGALPEPDAIHVAFGTGGTAVGLAIGLAAAGVAAPVVAVRVTDGLLVARPVLRALARRTVERLRARDPRFPDVARVALERLRVEHGFFGSGYGQPTRAGAEATGVARRAGLTLDPTYTAKAFASALAAARAAGEGLRDGPPRRILYWHTLSAAGVERYLAGAPPAPGWATRRALPLSPPT